MKKQFIYDVLGWALFAVLTIFGIDTIETIYKGMWHALNNIGIDREWSEMISAALVFYAVAMFAYRSVEFFGEHFPKKNKE